MSNAILNYANIMIITRSLQARSNFLIGILTEYLGNE